jgi:hypothetical protein
MTPELRCRALGSQVSQDEKRWREAVPDFETELASGFRGGGDRSCECTETAAELSSTAFKSALVGSTLQTFKQWRRERRGPRYLKVGSSVRYRVADLEEFVRAPQSGHERHHTRSLSLTFTVGVVPRRLELDVTEWTYPADL